MKKPIISLILTFTLTSYLSAAYVDMQADGQWDETSTWKSEPEAGNGINIRYALTIDQALSDTYKDFVIGDTDGSETYAGSLTITSKGSVKLTGVFNIARNVPLAGNGTMVLDGGKAECGAINLGSGNNSSSTAILTLKNGATLDAQRTINIGNNSGQTGIFRLEGSKNKFSTGTVTVRKQGHIEFVADAEGLSTIQTTGRVFYDSDKLLIDGSAYKGPAKTFTLIDAGSEGNTNYKGVEAKATVSGFKGYKTRVFIDGKALKLELSK